MFHVEQSSRLTRVCCSDLRFSAGAPGEEHVTGAVGKADGDLRSALSAAPTLASNPGIGESRKSESSKKSLASYDGQKNVEFLNFSIFLSLNP